VEYRFSILGVRSADVSLRAMDTLEINESY